MLPRRYACYLSFLVAAATALQPSSLPRRLSPAPRSDLRCVRLADDGNPLLRALAGLGQSALSKLEKEMQVAAMQDPEQFRPQEFLDAEPLPDSFEDAVRLASQACAAAMSDGITTLVVEFDTAAGDETYNMLSRTLTLVRPFLPLYANVIAPTTDQVEQALADAAGLTGVPLAPRIQLLFPDEGTAAYVKQNWHDLPARTTCTSMPRAQLAKGAQALVFVAPAATEVPAVQRLLQQVETTSPSTVVLMINPKLIDMQSTGYGLVGRELRTMIEQSFTVAFALKTYPEGALYRRYPEGWAVWRENAEMEGGYALAYSAARRPSGDDVAEYLTPPDDGQAGGSSSGGVGSALDGLGKFIKGFQAL